MSAIGKILLLPAALLYGFGVRFRNWSYAKGLLKITTFDEPVICVGNLSAGGTGKTPHVSYIVGLLKGKYNIATLSRGYGRSTKGFIKADEGATASQIGDEPLFYKLTHPEIIVSVGENRVNALDKLFTEERPDVVILDDGYQHRAVKPGFSVLLTDYNNLYSNDFLLPTGTLREPRTCSKRADVIVVTKCPSLLSPIERRRLTEMIKPYPYQRLYFSYVKYGDFTPTWIMNSKMVIGKDFYFERKFSILLLCGIANPEPLYNYLRDHTKNVQLMAFPDHYTYTLEDITKIKAAFDAIPNPNKIVLTTEKDWMRLSDPALAEAIVDLKIFYIPIEIAFHDKDAEHFNRQILDYVGGKKSTGATGYRTVSVV